MNDRSEAAALAAVFGAECGRIGTSSTKSSMGHLIAAAGAVEAAVCALAIARSEMPVNANLRKVDPDCQHLNLVCGAPRRARVRGAVSNSFGFGGSNSCLVFRHPDETEAAMAGER
jgi:3-oxoacyl-(acyl-carrier-protein) synthase